MEDDLNGRQSQWKTTSRKCQRKQMTSACLASKSCTELSPAQPQLVLIILLLLNFSLQFLTMVYFSSFFGPFLLRINISQKLCINFEQRLHITHWIFPVLSFINHVFESHSISRFSYLEQQKMDRKPQPGSGQVPETMTSV